MYVTISGAHGIGKTTIAELLSEENNYEHLPEAMDATLVPPKFGPTSGEGERGQYWFMGQVAAKEEALHNVGINSVVISDRTWTDIHIYSKELLDEDGYDIYRKIANAIPKTKPDLKIILWADPEKIAERIKKRDRDSLSDWGEDDFQYLIKINEAFREYYVRFKDIDKDLRLVNASGSLEDTYDTVKKIIGERLRHKK